MHPNLWQYVVLLEGLCAIGIATGVAQEALRREPLRLIGYAHVGILLICVSVVATVAANIDSQPNLATWLGAAGFALYLLGAAGSHAGFSLDRLLPHGYGRGATRA